MYVSEDHFSHRNLLRILMRLNYLVVQGKIWKNQSMQAIKSGTLRVKKLSVLKNSSILMANNDLIIFDQGIVI